MEHDFNILMIFGITEKFTFFIILILKLVY